MERRLRIQLTASVGAALLALMALILVVTSMVRTINANELADSYLAVIMACDGHLSDDPDDYESAEQADAIMESHYFVAWLDPQGRVRQLETDAVPTLDREEASRLAREAALAQQPDSGSIGDFRYLRDRDRDGSCELVLLDCARSNADLRFTNASLALVMLLGSAAVTAVFGLLSKEIAAPIVRSRESQQQFVVDAGHDLRTPVSIISADADVLAMDLGDDNEWLRDIKHQVGVMSDLTESLILLSRAATTDARKAGERVDLSALVDEQLHGFRSRSLTEGHEIRPSLAPGIVVRGNPNYLGRMVGALVDNALKYSSEGSPIDVGLAVAGRTHRTAELTVANAADEVDPLEVARWFDRFYQSDKARTHQRGGYGIGLSMVRAVAEAHGGRAFATAGDDARSVTFHVVLPLARGERKDG